MNRSKTTYYYYTTKLNKNKTTKTPGKTEVKEVYDFYGGVFHLSYIILSLFSSFNFVIFIHLITNLIFVS